MTHLYNQVCSRRKFLSTCAACAGCVAGGTLAIPTTARAAAPTSDKPKVRLVFCETTNDKPIWPNIGYDFDSRRGRILAALEQGCPDVQFLPAQLMDDPQQAADLLGSDGEVDGYLICIQGLGWRNDVVKLSATGKPTLVVDNLFGGSGLFLTRLPQIMRSGKPVDWVSSADDQDVVASARNFSLLGKGKGAADVANAFRASRRGNTPGDADWSCKADDVLATDLNAALRELKKTKLLVIGGGWGGDAFRKAAKEVVGVEFVPVSFEEISHAYAQADRDGAEECAAQWTEAASEVVEPDHKTIVDSAAMYLAMKQLIEARDASGISINCLGGFYGGHMAAYPCLGFSQLNNDGLVGGCEADQMSALTMVTMSTVVGRPGFISDPVIDTSKNEIIYAHCVAMTKPFGQQGATNPYLIRSHSEDRKGAALQSLLPPGYMSTTLELNPTNRQVLFHQAKTTGNNDSDMACRTKLTAVIKGDIEKLTEKWAMGWHRVTFYGDLKDHVIELCSRLNLELVEEA